MKVLKGANEKLTKCLSDNIIIIYLLFIFLILVLPFIFTRNSLGFGTKANEIGDAINGLTAPIIGAFSILLLYLAFRSQVEINRELIDFNNEQVKLTRKGIEINNRQLELTEIDIKLNQNQLELSKSNLELTRKQINHSEFELFIIKREFIITNYSTIKFEDYNDSISEFVEDLSLYIKEVNLYNFKSVLKFPEFNLIESIDPLFFHDSISFIKHFVNDVISSKLSNNDKWYLIGQFENLFDELNSLEEVYSNEDLFITKIINGIIKDLKMLLPIYSKFNRLRNSI